MDLVTGSTGIVGTQLLLELARQNKPFMAMRRPGSSTTVVKKVFESHGLGEAFESIQWIDAPLDDFSALSEAFKGADRVYHCAALVSFRPEDRDRLFETNEIGTRHVVDLCLEHGTKKLCYVSSTAAIGDKGINGQRTEESAWTTDRGKSVYALSKRLAELEVWRGTEEGLNAVMVNPGIIIGPGKEGQSSASMFSSVKKGLMFHTSGTNGFVYAGDVARAMVALMESEISAQRFLMVGENLPYKTVFGYIARALGRPLPKIFVPRPVSAFGWRVLRLLQKAGGPKASITRETVQSAYKKVEYSTEKIRRELGFSFTPIEEAVKQSAPYYL